MLLSVVPFLPPSCSDGTNVVKIFQMAILAGIKWKSSPKDDFYSECLELLGEMAADNARDNAKAAGDKAAAGAKDADDGDA